jgi:hypothetical protein
MDPEDEDMDPEDEDMDPEDKDIGGDPADDLADDVEDDMEESVEEDEDPVSESDMMKRYMKKLDEYSTPAPKPENPTADNSKSAVASKNDMGGEANESYGGDEKGRAAPTVEDMGVDAENAPGDKGKKMSAAPKAKHEDNKASSPIGS